MNAHLRIPILMYHSVSDGVSQRFRRFSVSPSIFKDQMDSLSKHGFTAVSCSDYGKSLAHAGKGLPERPIVLTFDDAFEDFHQNALPALVDHGFTATLFIPTEYVGKTSSWLHDVGEGRRTILSWSQLQEIQSSGIECGSHGDRHVPLDRSPVDAMKLDIFRSKSILEDRLGNPVLSFAYPHGFLNDGVKQCVQEAGFDSAYAIRYHASSLDDDRFALPRMIVLPNPSRSHFTRLVTKRRPPLEQSWFQLRSAVWHRLRRILPPPRVGQTRIRVNAK